MVWKGGSKGVFSVKGLYFVLETGGTTPFPFKNSVEPLDSFKGEFLNLGGLLRKYFGFGSASRKGMDLAQQMCFMQSGVRDHGSYPSSLCQGKIIMAASVLHFWCLVGYF